MYSGELKHHPEPAYMDDPGTVIWFSGFMYRVLQDNDAKTGWQTHTITDKWLLNRCRQELQELVRAVNRGDDPEAIIKEAADVANFAMMIADRANRKEGQ